MNEAATSNVLAVETVPLLAKVLKGSRAPSKQAATMLALLVSWSRSGGSLLDRNGDGKVDNPGDGDHRRGLAEARRRLHDAPSSGPSSPISTLCSAASTPRRAASTTAGTSTSTATSTSC